MLNTIIGALLPIVVVLLLGLFSGWHKDFDGNQASILNRMVMLYTLPLLLFGGTLGISRSKLFGDLPLALAVAAGMIGSFFIVLLIARFVFRRDLGTSSLQALTISGPAVPFVGVSVFWGLLVAIRVPSAAIREAVITMAVPAASLAVILAVQFKTAEQEMASSLLFSTVLSIPTMGLFMFLTH